MWREYPHKTFRRRLFSVVDPWITDNDNDNDNDNDAAADDEDDTNTHIRHLDEDSVQLWTRALDPGFQPWNHYCG